MSKNNANLCAALAYVFIGIVWYFIDDKMKKDKFVKYHVKQGIILLIAWVLWGAIVSILGLFSSILSLVPWVFAIWGIINALNKEEKELPLIGQYAKKLEF